LALIWVIAGVIFHKEELRASSKSGEESRILARHCCQLSPVNDLQFAQDTLKIHILNVPTLWTITLKGSADDDSLALVSNWKIGS
jgi:hypothetical protein